MTLHALGMFALLLSDICCIFFKSINSLTIIRLHRLITAAAAAALNYCTVLYCTVLYLTREALHSLIQTFVHSRFDYTATQRWLEYLKFIFRNFSSLCRTWLLIWCLKCAEVNTSPRFLKIYNGYLLVSE